MYKESQHMKFLLQKREAPSSQDQEPPGAPGTLSTGPALALLGLLCLLPPVTTDGVTNKDLSKKGVSNNGVTNNKKKKRFVFFWCKNPRQEQQPSDLELALQSPHLLR
ncbi:hypothetical protein DV515_00011453 [Chloebia gouldiae]|uniref:Uncharacterized protein n=1 Tax=Chloebia gouldiae TaxID=44316 RepID=A0A3L8S6B3_CHLGU|nr:hypothetical protein DV515_00011453 [Chloebia gouldiae]